VRFVSNCHLGWSLGAFVVEVRRRVCLAGAAPETGARAKNEQARKNLHLVLLTSGGFALRSLRRCNTPLMRVGSATAKRKKTDSAVHPAPMSMWDRDSACSVMHHLACSIEGAGLASTMLASGSPGDQFSQTDRPSHGPVHAASNDHAEPGER
jgi:hypothetical protein